MNSVRQHTILPRVFSFLAVAALLLTVSSPTVQAAVEIGKTAPSFTLVDTHGNPHQLSDFNGKIVVLEWTNHQCPFVRKHYGANNMQGLQKHYTGKGIVWLSIISSAPGKQGYVESDRANQLTTSRGASPTAVLLDTNGDVGRAYGARTTPHMYIIDTDGVLVSMGAIDSIRSANPADIEQAVNYVALGLDEVMAGKPVSNPVTKPYGCSVKY